VIRRLWRSHRGATITMVAAAVVAVVAVGLVGVLGGSPARRRSAVTAAHAGPRSQAAAHVPDRQYRPSYLPAQPGAVSPFPASQLAALETLSPPPPAYPPSLPPVPVAARKDAVDFALAFTRELLDINFPRESRAGLARWAQASSAATLFQGVPFAAAKNTLYASLFAPTGMGEPAAADPVPSAAAWQKDSRLGLVWHVSHLAAAPDPNWEDALGSGSAVLRDPLLTVYVVSGTLSARRHGHPLFAYPFTLGLGMGSALHYPGYGAASVGGWKAG
jgi:hypothetical protein